MTDEITLTWEDWIEIGEAFKKLGAYLSRKSTDTMPKTGKKVNYRQLLNNFDKERFDKVKSELDGLVCTAFPEKGEYVFYGDGWKWDGKKWVLKI